MAIQPFNSLGGFSVGEAYNVVIEDNGNIQSNVITANIITITGNISVGNLAATSNIAAPNVVITTGGNLWIGDTPFVRTLTIGARTGPVTVPMASNNSFNVPLAHGGNAVVYTT